MEHIAPIPSPITGLISHTVRATVTAMSVVKPDCQTVDLLQQTSAVSIYRKYRNIDSISISYRIVSPAEISKFSIYRDMKFRYIILPNFHSFIHSRLDLTVFHRVSVSEVVV